MLTRGAAPGLLQVGIIPARYASTRFPGKPLTMILGKPMIQRTYEQAKKVRAAAGRPGREGKI